MAKIRLTVAGGKGEDILGARLRNLIKNLSGKGQFFGGLRASDANLITASLVLNTNSKYWWYQEFGAGAKFEKPKGAPPFQRPSGVLQTRFGNTVQNPVSLNTQDVRSDIDPTSKAGRVLNRQRRLAGRFYAIRPRRGRKRLRYYKDGSWRVPMVAWHPGFSAWQNPEGSFGAQASPWGRGLIRVTLWQARLNMMREVRKISERKSVKEGWTEIDIRKEIVDIVNSEMAKAVRKLNRYTPLSKSGPLPDRSNMRKSGHIRGTWSFTPAA